MIHIGYITWRPTPNGVTNLYYGPMAAKFRTEIVATAR